MYVHMIVMYDCFSNALLFVLLHCFWDAYFFKRLFPSLSFFSFFFLFWGPDVGQIFSRGGCWLTLHQNDVCIICNDVVSAATAGIKKKKGSPNLG